MQRYRTCVFTAVVVGMDVTPGSLHLATGDPSTHMLLKFSQPVHAAAAAAAAPDAQHLSDRHSSIRAGSRRFQVLRA